MDTLPADERRALPAADDVAAAFDVPLSYHGQQRTFAEYLERVTRDEPDRDGAP